MLQPYKAAWIKAANSLKVRYLVRLSRVQPQRLTEALGLISAGFANNAEGLVFSRYEAALYKANPWWEFRYIRAHLSVSQTLLGLMTTEMIQEFHSTLHRLAELMLALQMELH